ncbi:MAG: T9SS type A sorting domain-containing protein [Sphingobacteriales bacterium]|nr:T9SS type A sorting domain-containing protein [Sphingobacteriales bacterium]MBP6664054.1 T9SS type A sorting domain-containing protein [Chitinophagales bacterium]
MKLFSLLFAFMFVATISKAQTTAMDFMANDCNGVPQHLFADLDEGNAVIIEFFMLNCGSCPVAGHKLETMKATLMTQYPGKVKSYAIGFSNSYTCTQISNWVTTNGFTSIPMSGGGAQVAHYGGMGMPTVVILGGGAEHLVLGEPYIGLSTSDTTTIANDIREFLDVSTAVNAPKTPESNFAVYPNPANDLINLSFDLKTAGNVAINIIDVTGKKVATIMNEEVSSGKHTKLFSTASLQNGIYYVQITEGTAISAHKLTIIR